MPCQLRSMTGSEDPAIQGVVVRLNRLSGPNSGSDPHVELALTSREDLLVGASLPSRSCRPVLGCATAVPVSCICSGAGRGETRAIRTVADIAGSRPGHWPASG